MKSFGRFLVVTLAIVGVTITLDHEAVSFMGYKKQKYDIENTKTGEMLSTGKLESINDIDEFKDFDIDNIYRIKRYNYLAPLFKSNDQFINDMVYNDHNQAIGITSFKSYDTDGESSDNLGYFIIDFDKNIAYYYEGSLEEVGETNADKFSKHAFESSLGPYFENCDLLSKNDNLSFLDDKYIKAAGKIVDSDGNTNYYDISRYYTNNNSIGIPAMIRNLGIMMIKRSSIGPKHNYFKRAICDKYMSNKYMGMFWEAIYLSTDTGIVGDADVYESKLYAYDASYKDYLVCTTRCFESSEINNFIIDDDTLNKLADDDLSDKDKGDIIRDFIDTVYENDSTSDNYFY